MEFKKKTHKYMFDENSSIYINKYECPPCDELGTDSNTHKLELLKLLINNQNSLDAISNKWEKLIVKHNGICWQLILETRIEEKNI